MPDHLRRIALLAAGPEPSEVGLVLPPEWGGRCNLGLESLNLSYLVKRIEVPAVVASHPATQDALIPVRRRLERLALGGRSTIFPGVIGNVELDARRLEADLMHCAAALQRGVALAGLDRATGAAERFAAAFTAAGEHCRVAQLSLQRSAWRR
jgi:hypothetical protein